MENKTILILGGYGGTGQRISQLLLKETDAHLIIAGRRREKAEALSERLNREFAGGRVSGRYADASQPESLAAAFHGVDMVLVAATTTAYVKQVAQAALNAGIDYLDIHFPQKVVHVLVELAPDMEKAGRCFITQAGFHPGLPAVFVRRAAPHFDRYRRAVVGMVMNARIEQPESVYELIDEVGDYQSEIFKGGRWKKGGYKDAVKIDFGPPFGTRLCYPIQMEEIKLLPERFGLEDVGVYVAGFNWFVDNIVFPLAMLLNKIRKGVGRHSLARLMVWGINTFSGPVEGVVFILDAAGEKGGNPRNVRIVAAHHDAYAFTAIPVVACVRQYLSGDIVKPGLWLMGHIVEPVCLMNDMERMGIRIQIQE